MNNLPKINESSNEPHKKKSSKENSAKSPGKSISKHKVMSIEKPITYDYFSTRIPRCTVEEGLLKLEKDDRFVYFLRYGILRRYEGHAEVLFIEIPQIPKKIVVYRRPSTRVRSNERLYLNAHDLPHIPLFEGEENLKLLSMEHNLISKIDHLVSLNSLLYLNLYANKIQEIENLTSLPKLRALMLGKNLIEKINNLGVLVELEVLDLHSNKIKLIDNLSSLRKLRLLNLANNQITSFTELLHNKNLEEVNLRKNLIVSVPSSLHSLDRLKKLNMGKNMISKTEFFLELQKVRSLTELIVEDNPVLVLRETAELLKKLPIKVMNTSKGKESEDFSPVKKQSFSKTSSGNNTYKVTTASVDDISGALVPVNKEFSPKKVYQVVKRGHNMDSICESTEQVRVASKARDKTQEVDDEPNSILNQIESEWQFEMEYIKQHGYDGFTTKKLKDTKVYSGHAEIEDDRKLNVYGNALEVLEREHLYQDISILQFQFYNIDLIAQKTIVDQLKKFVKLNKLIFIDNNLHSFYQLIKFENLNSIQSLSISQNEICQAHLLKYFVIYRFQNLKVFNKSEITPKEISVAKKIFEHFDKVISKSERDNSDEGNCKGKEEKVEKQEEENLELKNKFYFFVKENLAEVLEDLVESA